MIPAAVETITRVGASGNLAPGAGTFADYTIATALPWIRVASAAVSHIRLGGTPAAVTNLYIPANHVVWFHNPGIGKVVSIWNPTAGITSVNVAEVDV